nr:MAG TPA: hypothetical protein [Caudoviricetes sp.]
MGYRPTFKCLDGSGLEFYGTKLYGYCDETKCFSYQYLLEIGKIDFDTIWDYGCDNSIILSPTQFATFVTLYEVDMNNYSPFHKGVFRGI